MASEDCTMSSLTSEPDDLTALHQLSGLQTEHQSRRTKTRFLIKADRLPNCVLLPISKIPLRSWIWDHGVALGYITHKKDVHKHWLYQICYNKEVPPPLSSFMISTEQTTTKVITHLVDLHQFDRLGNKVLPSVSKKRKG